jgi:hypothetical protein
MTEDKPKYLAYLLRLWQVQDPQGTTPHPEIAWRVSLEDVSTHVRHGFASLKKAFVFLSEQIVPTKEDNDETE